MWQRWHGGSREQVKTCGRRKPGWERYLDGRREQADCGGAEKNERSHCGIVLKEGDTGIVSVSCGFFCVHGILRYFLAVMRFYLDV